MLLHGEVASLLAFAYMRFFTAAKSLFANYLQMNHGWFQAKDIPDLDINSNVCTVGMGAIGKLIIDSKDD